MDNSHLELLTKLSERTISYFKEELNIIIENNYLIEEVNIIDYFDITTLIALNKDMTGTIGMSVSNKLAYKMVKNFIFGDMEKEELESLSGQNVAETLNVTLGNILHELTIIQNGGDIGISPPHTMIDKISITKKKNGTMLISKLKLDNNEEIILSYFI